MAVSVVDDVPMVSVVLALPGAATVVLEFDTVHPVNTYPELGVAEMLSVAPTSTIVPEVTVVLPLVTVTEPPPLGLTDVLSA